MSDDRVFAKCAWRLMPLILAGYFVNFLDRTNVGFAALTMNRDLGFSPSVFGFGAGILFLSYGLFQIPANMLLDRIGARRWIFCILALWGAISALNAFTRDAATFYVLRFFLGVAEAGFQPGILLYLTFWFPKAYLGRLTALFIAASVVSLVIGGPLAGLIFQMDGAAGLHGWQWLFVIEGLPACMIAFAVLRFLPDGPAHTPWLDDEERRFIATHLQAEATAKDQNLLRALRDPRVLFLGLAYGGVQATSIGFAVWLPQMVQSTGFSITTTGWLLAVIYSAAIPAMVLWARSSDTRGERIWHFALSALFVAAALAIASVARGLFMLPALAAAELAIPASVSTLIAIPALFLSGRAMAGGIALFGTIGTLLGGFGGQYLIGVVREQTGGYAAVLGTLSAAMVLSTIIVVVFAPAIAPRVSMKRAKLGC